MYVYAWKRKKEIIIVLYWLAIWQEYDDRKGKYMPLGVPFILKILVISCQTPQLILFRIWNWPQNILWLGDSRSIHPVKWHAFIRAQKGDVPWSPTTNLRRNNKILIKLDKITVYQLESAIFKGLSNVDNLQNACENCNPENYVQCIMKMPVNS